MSRPSDEYFAAPGPAPSEPPAGYFGDTARHCPDDGTCHHECVDTCFRVQYCEPLSGVYPNDEWPTFETAPHTYTTPSSAPIRGMHCDRLFVDEMWMVCGRRNGKQFTLGEIARLGRKVSPPPPRQVTE